MNVDLAIEPWHVPLLVMAGLILSEYLLRTVTQGRSIPKVKKQAAKRSALVVLVVLAAAMVVIALGPTLADQLASVAAAVAMLMTLLHYRAGGRSRSDRSTDTPHPPAGDDTLGDQGTARSAAAEVEGDDAGDDSTRAGQFPVR